MIRKFASRLAHLKQVQRVTQSASFRRVAGAGLMMALYAQQASAQVIGSNMGQAICKFKDSGIVPVVVAVAIIAIAIMLILNEGKGLGSWVVRIIIGAAAIAAIGSIVTWVVPAGTLGC